MRHQPLGVDGVAREAAADMIVDPAVGDVIEGAGDGVEIGLVAGPDIGPPDELEDGGLREFRRAG